MWTFLVGRGSSALMLDELSISLQSSRPRLTERELSVFLGEVNFNSISPKSIEHEGRGCQCFSSDLDSVYYTVYNKHTINPKSDVIIFSATVNKSPGTYEEVSNY